jgi:hypothetical protein
MGLFNMGNKRVTQKVRGKKDVLDEWEITDIDRNEQKAGLDRRARRWKEIELEQKEYEKLQKALEKRAKAMESKKIRPPTKAEMGWLKCDYILHFIMEPKAYDFMYKFTKEDPECYKYLYKIFISPYMIASADMWIKYFSTGNKPDRIISY